MKTAIKAGTVGVTAVALLLSAAALNLRDGVSTGATRAGGPPESSALLAPSAAAGSLDTTIASLQDRLGAIPHDWRAYASLGLAYVVQARVTADPSWYPLADGALRESLRLHDEDNVEALLGLGALALARHDFEAALQLGRDARAIAPHDADAYGVVGDALLELGHYRRAFAVFQTMVDTRPNLASYARVSYARELLGDVPGAVDAMEQAFGAAGTPSDAAWTAYQIGELEFGRAEVGAAAAWFERGMDVEPGFVANLAGLAKVAWARGDLSLAVERYTEVVAALPSVEHVAALGDLYAAMGRRALAEQQYAVVEATRAIAVSGGVNVDLEIALFDADHGDPAAALVAAEAEWRRRESVQVADAYAWALYVNGRYAQAARLSGRALALGTRNALFLFHAGMIERTLGHDGSAVRLLREALATTPHLSILHAPTAERVLSRLEAAR